MPEEETPDKRTRATANSSWPKTEDRSSQKWPENRAEQSSKPAGTGNWNLI